MYYLCICTEDKIEFTKYVSFSMRFRLKKNISALNNNIYIIYDIDSLMQILL